MCVKYNVQYRHYSLPVIMDHPTGCIMFCTNANILMLCYNLGQTVFGIQLSSLLQTYQV